MRISPMLLAVAVALAACGSPDEEASDECGDNGDCPSGYTCDPVERRCVMSGGQVADAGVPDAPPQLGCPVPTGGPTMHSTEVKADEVWTANGSPHIVPTTLRVTGTATLTLEPCAEVLLGKDATLIAGFGGAASKIKAAGTADRPVTIKQKVAGERFSGIEADLPGTLDLAYVTIEGGGADRFRRGASIVGWGDGQLPVKPVVKLDHVTVKDSAGMGVLLERSGTFVPGSKAVTVSGSGTLNSGEGEAMRVDLMAAGDVPDGNYGGNPNPAITVYGGNVDSPLALRNVGVPFRMADATGIIVRNGGALTIAAGVEVLLHKVSTVVVRGGSLVASGTAEQPIRFRPRTGSPDDRWQVIEVDQPGTMSLTHVILEGGGTDRFVSYASLVARGDSAAPLKKILHVDDVQVKNSGGAGLLVERWAAFDDSSRDLVVTGSGATQPALGHAVRIAIPAAATLPAGAYTGNAVEAMMLDTSVTIAGEETIRDRGLPYYTTGSLVIRPPTQDTLARLTVEPGVTLRFPKGLFGVVVGVGSTGSAAWPGELVAVGTADKPITFSSADPAPAPGDWRGIYFQGYRATGNKLVHARVEYAGADCLCSVGGCGGAEEAGVMFFLYPLSERVVSQTSFAHIAGHGIYSNFRSDDTAGLDMTADNTFEDVSGCAQTMLVSSTGQCSRACM